MKPIKISEHGILKFTDLDMLPSDVMANALEIRHSKMKRTIERVKKQLKKMEKDHATTGHISKYKKEYPKPVFKEYFYTDTYGRTQKNVIMNQDAALITIMESRSPKAFEMKLLFIADWKRLRLEREVRTAEVSYSLNMTDSLKAFYERLVLAGTRQPENGFYSTVQRKIHKKATGRKMPKGGIDHSSLSVEEMAVLMAIRSEIPNWIKEGKNMGMDARETRRHFYDRIEAFRVVSIDTGL